MRLAKTIQGQVFELVIEHRTGGHTEVTLVPKDGRLAPVAHAIRAAWLNSPEKLLDAVAHGRGLSFEGAAWFDYQGDEVEAGYLSSDARVSRKLFDDLVAAYAKAAGR